METHTEIVTAPNGAVVEMVTIKFQGHEFTAMGSVVDKANGLIVGYPKKTPSGWTIGDGVASDVKIRLISSWKQRMPNGFFPWTRIYAWSAVVDGVRYSGRNSGEGMLLRMRAKKVD